jgi:hypothetical protein
MRRRLDGADPGAEVPALPALERVGGVGSTEPPQGAEVPALPALERG